MAAPESASRREWRLFVLVAAAAAALVVTTVGDATYAARLSERTVYEGGSVLPGGSEPRTFFNSTHIWTYVAFDAHAGGVTRVGDALLQAPAYEPSQFRPLFHPVPADRSRPFDTYVVDGFTFPGDPPPTATAPYVLFHARYSHDDEPPCCTDRYFEMTSSSPQTLVGVLWVQETNESAVRIYRAWYAKGYRAWDPPTQDEIAAVPPLPPDTVIAYAGTPWVLGNEHALVSGAQAFPPGAMQIAAALKIAEFLAAAATVTAGAALAIVRVRDRRSTAPAPSPRDPNPVATETVELLGLIRLGESFLGRLHGSLVVVGILLGVAGIGSWVLVNDIAAHVELGRLPYRSEVLAFEWDSFSRAALVLGFGVLITIWLVAFVRIARERRRWRALLAEGPWP